MKRMLMSLLAAAVLTIGGLAAPASAGTILDPVYDPQMVKPGETASTGLSGGVYTAVHNFAGSWHSFTDTISFTVTAATDLTLSLVQWGDIELDFTLTNVGTGAEADMVKTSLKSGSVAGHSGLVLTELLSLSDVGSWVLTISGAACHCAGYAVSLAQAAVTPIPPAMVMFLTALGGLGGFAWRRKKALAAA